MSSCAWPLLSSAGAARHVLAAAAPLRPPVRTGSAVPRGVTQLSSQRCHFYYGLRVSSPELAESLALTAPGDEIGMRVKGRFDEVEAGQQCPLLELVNETVANALRFPAMGELPVPMKHSAFD